MPKISRANADDCGGGIIMNTRGIQSTLNGQPIAVEGDVVAPHGTGPHASATTTASANTTINGYRIVLEGDPATCGHPATASANSEIN